MRKLKLDLEAIEVESFVTGGDAGDGTVKGHDSTTDCSQACSLDCEDSMGETGCGPCLTHALTRCQHATCAQTYCGASCQNASCPTWCPTNDGSPTCWGNTYCGSCF